MGPIHKSEISWDCLISGRLIEIEKSVVRSHEIQKKYFQLRAHTKKRGTTNVAQLIRSHAINCEAEQMFTVFYWCVLKNSWVRFWNFLGKKISISTNLIKILQFHEISQESLKDIFVRSCEIVWDFKQWNFMH